MSIMVNSISGAKRRWGRKRASRVFAYDLTVVVISSGYVSF